MFSTGYAQCNVCRRVIGLFVQQGNLRCVWFMIRARRLNLEETAISSTCVRLIARPVVQHTCIINPKIFNIRNRMYYSKKPTISSCFLCFYEAIFTKISHFSQGRDLVYNTFVPFNFIPTFFRTRRAKFREQSLFIWWRGWTILGRSVNFLYRYCGGQFLKPLSLGAVNLSLKHLVVKKRKSNKKKTNKINV